MNHSIAELFTPLTVLLQIILVILSVMNTSPKAIYSQKLKIFQSNCDFVLALHSTGWGYQGDLKVKSIQIFNNYCEMASKRKINKS